MQGLQMAKINVLFSTNAKQASREVNQLNTSFDKQEKELKDLKAAHDIQNRGVDKFLQKQKKIQKGMELTSNKIAAQSVKRRNLEKEIRKLVNRGLNPESTAVKRLIRERDKATRSIDRNTRAKTRNKKRTDSLRTSVRALALASAAAGAAVIAMVNKIANQGDEIAKTARNIGFTSESLQEFRFVAERQGVTSEAITKGFKKFNRAIGEVQLGITGLSTKYKNVNPEMLEILKTSKNTEEAFFRIAPIINGYSNQMQKAQVASDLFGRSGIDLLNMLGTSTEEFASLRKEARDYGIISNKQAKDSEVYADAMTNLQKSIKGVSIILAKELTPAFTDAAQFLAREIPKYKIYFEGVGVRITEFSTKIDSTLKFFQKMFKSTAEYININFGLPFVKMITDLQIGFTKLELMYDQSIFGNEEDVKKTEAALKKLNAEYDNLEMAMQNNKKSAAELAEEFAQASIQLSSETEAATDKANLAFSKLYAKLDQLAKKNPVSKDIKKVKDEANDLFKIVSSQPDSQFIPGFEPKKEEPKAFTKEEFEKALAPAETSAAIANLEEELKLKQAMEKEYAEFKIEYDKGVMEQIASNRKMVNEQELQDNKAFYSSLSSNAQWYGGIATQIIGDLGKLNAAYTEDRVKEAKIQKALSISQAAINTAMAVTVALSQPTPAYWINIANAAIAATAGAVEIATIASTPIPSAETGGQFRVIGGSRVDDVNFGGGINLNDGEEANLEVTPRSETSREKAMNINIDIGKENMIRFINQAIFDNEILVNQDNVR